MSIVDGNLLHLSKCPSAGYVGDVEGLNGVDKPEHWRRAVTLLSEQR